MSYSNDLEVLVKGGAVYAAVVNDERGQRVYHVGALDEAATERTFRRIQPDIPAAAVAYRLIHEDVGNALGVRPGSVRLWDVGAPVRYDLQANRIIW